MKLIDFYTKQNIELNKDINMYVCGPTVYSDPHIGNMRPIITFDVLNRLASLEGNVNFVHNITDVDDKIIAKAKELGISEKEVSEKYEAEYLKLLEQVNVKTPTHMPKVMDNIESMISFIEKMVQEGNAYESNGSVYFSIKDFDNYGKLLASELDNIIEIEENADKEDPRDFALWKKTEEGVSWDSPWGKGRPGWHTECSYFINKYFGENGLDVHGGGIDLKFPHHINEAAQYEACCKVEETSKVWSYVGHLFFDDEKMSKSVGNIVSAKEFINEHGAETLRMVMLQTSMLKPIDLSDDVINNANKLVEKIRNAIVKAFITLATESDYTYSDSKPSEEFIAILGNNLDTVNSITYVLEQIKTINSGIVGNEKILEELISNLTILGFEYDIKFNEVKEKIKEAKENSDYETLDKLREEII